MYKQIHNLIAALSKANVLLDVSVSTTLIDLAQELKDDDFAAALLGDVALAFARSKDFEKAEEIASLIKGQERSEHLRTIAEAEARVGGTHQARLLLQEAIEAASVYEFPTQRAQSIAAIATTMEIIDKDAAAKTWETAVTVAGPAQDAGGTDGPEASGVLFEAVEALLRLGRGPAAHVIASQIKLPTLRDRAATLCK